MDADQALTLMEDRGHSKRSVREATALQPRGSYYLLMVHQNFPHRENVYSGRSTYHIPHNHTDNTKKTSPCNRRLFLEEFERQGGCCRLKVEIEASVTLPWPQPNGPGIICAVADNGGIPTSSVPPCCCFVFWDSHIQFWLAHCIPSGPSQ